MISHRGAGPVPRNGSDTDGRNIATLTTTGNHGKRHGRPPRRSADKETSAPRAGGVRIEIVSDGDSGRRLDNLLASYLRHAPRSLVYKLVRSGQVRVNGARARPDRRLAAGDRVRIPPVAGADDRSPGSLPRRRLDELAAAIVFEDEHFLVFDKPAGLACHAGSGLRYGVIELARVLRPHAERLDLAHRLDRETSGCLVLAKTLDALRAFQHDDEPGAKHYQALLCGRLDAAVQVVDAPLKRIHTGGSGAPVSVDPQGKPALTRILRQQPCGPHTLVEIALDTGRMHQIRAHARHLGHPVAGDPLYGDAAANATLRDTGLGRLFLHADSLTFNYRDHRYHWQAVLPEDLSIVLRRLGADDA